MPAQEPCKHPVQLFGMCAVCGKPVDADSEESASLSIMHSSAAVKVSAEEAQRLDSESTSHLLSQRKLALIVDLDQTVIHATVDPTVGEWMKDESNPNYEALKSVGKFRLGIDGEEIKDDNDESLPKDSAAALKASRACWYYVKPRPGLPQILKQLSQKYELHVYTMGTRSYANCVCKLIDPDASIFGNRILSRDENGSLVRKSLNRLFPVDHSMVVIIDDREDVWGRSPNLLPVLPYEFFVGIGDINATFLPAVPSPPGALPDAVPSTSANKLDDASPSASSPPTSSDSGRGTSATAASTPEAIVEVAVWKAEAEGDHTDEEPQAVRQAAAHFAEQTQKLQNKLAEQREARPLAKMQEALDEKLGRNGESRSGTATPNGNVDTSISHHTPAGDGSSSDSETSAAEQVSDSASAAETSEDATNTNDTISPTTDTTSNVSSLPQPPPPPPLPPHRSHAVLVDDDTELDRVYSILDSLHTEWYSKYDAMQSHPKPQSSSDPTIQKPSVVDLIGAKKCAVLTGCVIVFSSMIPFGTDAEKSDLWAMAREFGATPASEIEPGVTTHVVAARPGTAKVHQALRLAQKDDKEGDGGSGGDGKGKLEVVWPSWFHVSSSRWERQDEALYRISVSENTLASATAAEIAANKTEQKSLTSTASTTNGQATSSATQDSTNEDSIMDKAAGGQEGETLFESELVEMDWGAAADEVDAYLDSVTTASNTSSPALSVLGFNDVADLPNIEDADQVSLGVSRKRARVADEDDDIGDDFKEGLLGGKEGKKHRPGQDREVETGRKEEEEEEDDDDFLDDLANELDGQLDDE
ncbi:related to FCP1 - TFIIF interacting component of CTD phosphatase [Melanopsichium pennsylvanicum]|uniref:RNA polymerase II subunit A C-terminal domain phosphatase n=1 Tax=Melanopsichium pennsylvanicum TaxID=63383 RepID=A0AAJ5C2U3_9BASI|nr:related to FCP1 - TFIIF interacting component of CTD phosphatase [Melanopsichium pennsylvanicum]